MTKVIRMPSATGRSMLTVPSRKSRSALAKKGLQENSSTGSVSTHEAQRNSFSMSGVMSPGSVM